MSLEVVTMFVYAVTPLHQDLPFPPSDAIESRESLTSRTTTAMDAMAESVLKIQIAFLSDAIKDLVRLAEICSFCLVVF